MSFDWTHSVHNPWFVLSFISLYTVSQDGVHWKNLNTIVQHMTYGLIEGGSDAIRATPTRFVDDDDTWMRTSSTSTGVCSEGVHGVSSNCINCALYVELCWIGRRMIGDKMSPQRSNDAIITSSLFTVTMYMYIKTCF